MQEKPFSKDLEAWLKSQSPKTIAALSQAFSEKSFAVAFLILLFIPALPLPTGGISHVFEVIAMLLALELIAGRRVIWLPKRWRHKALGKAIQGRAIPFIIRRVRWFERFSRKRLGGILQDQRFLRLVGLVVFVFCFAAFIAPPFSGLDTLPALGVVVVSLSIILEDFALFALGLLLGAVGIGIEIALSTAFTKLLF